MFSGLDIECKMSIECIPENIHSMLLFFYHDRRNIAMYMSKMFIPTLKEVPNDSEIASHKLMIRAGLARSLTSDVYNYTYH